MVVMVTATGVLIAGRAAPEPGAARAEAATVRLAWEQGACVERESGRFELAACGEADGKVISRRRGGGGLPRGDRRAGQGQAPAGRGRDARPGGPAQP
nr:hypothetical protein GCM10020093_061190 [Planobispora longispora]